jgi:hypothetical protein
MDTGRPDLGSLCQNVPEWRKNLLQGPSVGSPLLGHPGGTSQDSASPAEVYVVTTTGTVQAFDTTTATLEPRWVQNLGIRISPTAQPVLVGSTLWVVSSSGEVRGVQVNSNGLSRSAQWPKAFRDNCNSSSGRVAYAASLSPSAGSYIIPACFGAAAP